MHSRVGENCAPKCPLLACPQGEIRSYPICCGICVFLQKKNNLSRSCATSSVGLPFIALFRLGANLDNVSSPIASHVQAGNRLRFNYAEPSNCLGLDLRYVGPQMWI